MKGQLVIVIVEAGGVGSYIASRICPRSLTTVPL